VVEQQSAQLAPTSQQKALRGEHVSECRTLVKDVDCTLDKELCEIKVSGAAIWVTSFYELLKALAGRLLSRLKG